MPVRGRVFGRFLRRVSEIPNVLFQRFKVSVVGVLKILGPVEIQGVGTQGLEVVGNIVVLGGVEIKQGLGTVGGDVPLTMLDMDDVGNLIFKLGGRIDSTARFQMQGDGGMAWGPGSSAIDMSLFRDDTQTLTMDFGATGTGAGKWLFDGVISIADSVTAPATASGKAFFYIDTADGDAKIKFGDGTVVVIASGGSTLTTVEIDRRYALLVG